MESSPPLYSVLLLVLVASPALFVSPARSTSQQTLEHPKLNKTGFWVKLKQVDSGKNFFQLERIQNGIKRGQHRLQKIANGLAHHDLRAISSPVSPVNHISEFFLEFSIGTPLKTDQLVLLDTASDLIWIQCKSCINCFKQNNPIFDQSESLSFFNLSSSSELCKALPRSTPTIDGWCEYYYKYRDDSSTSGIMGRENFTLGDVIVPNLGFGCGEDYEGDGFSPGAGVVGLGRGLLSLVSQLKETKFAYCLPSIEDPKNSGRLLIGSPERISIDKLMKTTPLIRNWFEPSRYYVSLEGISVGGTKLHMKKSTALKDDGTGGLYIDSGAPITHLEKSAYDLVREEFINQAVKLSEDKSGLYVFDLCFNLPKERSDRDKVPKLIFHFDGADWELPRKNYMIEDENNGVMCLGIVPSRDDVSMFGALQQQNMLVISDLEKDTLSFVPTECDQL
ncbi:aspartyl protease family protein [Tripterygium wilfordii]|uniref:Aspartyl protease family protein n=1 Tax=Tripterygium wilfordii TaxID=458696 RepID=A0A7J7DFC2_TRIWF|nr:aspartic proteinase nepenthesin-1-like [Tripterygium wilfordii]KAF5745057.1 aspartyl protease family protein [Tripterygium wilfordii]